MGVVVPPGITDKEWQRQFEGEWDHFCAVLAEDAEVLNDWGSVSHSPGAGNCMFDIAESRLTASHADVARRAAGVK